VVELVDVLFQSGHLGVHVGLLQGGDVVDLDGGRVNRRLRAVAGADTGQELRRGLLLGQGVDVPLCLPVGLADRRLETDDGLDQRLTGLDQGRDIDLTGLTLGDAVERLNVSLDLCQATDRPVLDLQCLGERDLCRREADVLEGPRSRWLFLKRRKKEPPKVDSSLRCASTGGRCAFTKCAPAP
jgi:hypothetical protein